VKLARQGSDQIVHYAKILYILPDKYVTVVTHPGYFENFFSSLVGKVKSNDNISIKRVKLKPRAAPAIGAFNLVLSENLSFH
jgi:hypothetical protein